MLRLLMVSLLASGCIPRISVDDLVLDGHANEVGAAQTAKGKTIEVDGTIVDLTFSQGKRPQPYAEVQTARGTVVRCFLLRDEDATGVAKGSPVKLRGWFHAFYRLAYDALAVQMRGCQFDN